MLQQQKAYNVLFLCTGNSARSIIAECILNRLDQGRFTAYSAGSHPAGKVNPNVLALLQQRGHPTDGLRSKSWDEFAALGAPQIDFIFTVCDDAAGEVCPVWPGRPITAHWGIPDPAAIEGSAADIAAAFADAYSQLEKRIAVLVSLPLPDLDAGNLRARLDAIGKAIDTPAPGESH